MIDYTDSKELDQFSLENVRLSEEYAKSRNKHASAQVFLNKKLAEAYKDGKVNQGASVEKALLFLTNDNLKCQVAHEALIIEKGNYKGLDKVIQTRQARVSLSQSLIKNKINNT